MNLISDILDLSKIESGTVTVDAEEILTANLLDTVGRPFRHEAENRNLSFKIDVDPTSRTQHRHRLQAAATGAEEFALQRLQVHRRGEVRLTVVARSAAGERIIRCSTPQPAVIAFEVSDTGIGIPPEKQKLIFEAFQQADAGTSRKYGGTGLGLAISRELANLLGGEIHLRSTPGKGSTFTLYLPLNMSARHCAARPSVAGAAIRPAARAPAGRAARSASSSRCPTTASTSSPATASC